ncbi:hypothetical protein SISSUDRAFT_1115617 [Sistotremastrum suecicum HHB10207 ss-3]|uniref:F-box domain-containing protein n=1 Tax=Sistotremastrum suecicum HHB10207 ss-3 TaxID=1314776 RepID=A0A166J2B4_9AGAM|nr:hypothetical protein SISSUDRAFT_1115617 [Sistotremastrum suecicum HHB10207 ss-3]
MAKLEALPSEIYVEILSHLRARELKSTTLALSRALPRAPVPVRLMFNDVVLSTTREVALFSDKIRKTSSTLLPRSWIHCLQICPWTCSPDVQVILLEELPDLTALRLNIGSTFTPEHLQDILRIPRPDLSMLSLRFRPYVDKVTHLPFLKGLYFDSVLTLLSLWPSSRLHHLSLVQDPEELGVHPMLSARFAQPIVFFALQNISSLACSPLGATVTHLRLRIPRRRVAAALYPSRDAFPSLQLLDISTTQLSESEIGPLMSRFVLTLKHLILDDCFLSNCFEIAKQCAQAGVQRAKEAERELTSPEKENWAKDQPRSKGHVIPPPVRLQSLSFTLAEPTDHSVCRDEFERGWAAGVSQDRAVRERLTMSVRRGRQALVFEDSGCLVRIPNLDDVPDTVDVAPMLCFIGSGFLADFHRGCGHHLECCSWRDTP